MDITNEILKKLSQGDESVFEKIFHLFYKEIFVYVRSILTDNEESEEITQQCFVNLWEKHPDANKITSLRPYLYRSAYNMCMNRFEHNKVKLRYQSETEYKLRTIEFEDFEESYQNDLLHHISKAIEQLPPKSREVFKLRYIENLSNEEISAKLDLSKRTVENHLYTSLQFLRSQLKHILLIVIFFNFFRIFTE